MSDNSVIRDSLTLILNLLKKTSDANEATEIEKMIARLQTNCDECGKQADSLLDCTVCHREMCRRCCKFTCSRCNNAVCGESCLAEHNLGFRFGRATWCLKCD